MPTTAGSVQLCSTIKQASSTGNMRATYEGIKQVSGPAVKNTDTLKSKSGEALPIKQMERWLKHYIEMYSSENTVSEDTLKSITTLSPLDGLDTEQTMCVVKLETAINALASGKAPGNYATPSEVIKKENRPST